MIFFVVVLVSIVLFFFFQSKNKTRTRVQERKRKLQHTRQRYYDSIMPKNENEATNSSEEN
jgi:hypothetical protein